MLRLWGLATSVLFISYIFLISSFSFGTNFKSDRPVVALILARGGSKGIKLKNLALISNVTLLSRAILTVQQSKKFDSIWISTDHEAIANEARLRGALVHYRAPYTATDTASSIVAVLEFLHHHPDVGVLGLIQATSPFLRPQYLSNAVDLMKSSKYNSVFSVTRQFKLRWTNISGEMLASNFEPYSRPRRQDWEGELIENGMFYLTRSSHLIKYNTLQPPRVGVIEIPLRDSLEIDSPLDLKIAQYLDSERNSNLDDS